MNEDIAIDSGCGTVSREIRRLDVDSPLGVVHLAGFAQKPDHRSVIFGILSDYWGAPVGAADLCESPENSRPHFPELDFDVNWTHSGGYCVVAFGERGSLGRLRIGVDLERLSPRRLHLADRFFSAEEAACVKTLVESGKSGPAEREFFRLWCRKEAFYKCVGGDFFEGTLRRDMKKNPVRMEPAKKDGEPLTVHFVDLDGATVGVPVPSALCIAVSRF